MVGQARQNIMSDLVKDQKAELSEEATAAQNVVEALMKAMKNIRIYPRNNPMYRKNIDYFSGMMNKFFHYKESLVFSYGRNNIYYDYQSIYESNQAQDNLAMLFFKDGVRELTFHKGLTSEEMEEFLEIVSQDYDKEVIDDDIATLLWQSDFKHISYIIDDTFAFDEDDSESSLANQNRSKDTDPTDLKNAYDDSFEDDRESEPVSIVPLTTEDFKLLLNMLERDADDKTNKFFNILFEIYNNVERVRELEDIVFFFMSTIEYSITQKRFDLVIDVITRLKKIVADNAMPQDIKKGAVKILLFVSGRKLINIVGEIIDGDKKIDKKMFQNFIYLLDRNAISSLVNLLGHLQNIHARKMVIDALIRMGPKDMSLILQGLKHSEWYVIRNIIYILRKIGDVNTLEIVSDAIKHKDIRVKKEVLITLGEFGNDSELEILKEYLFGNEPSLRKIALTSLGQISTNSAKKIIMEHISNPSFKELKLNEKKDFFTVLTYWNDSDTFDFLVKIISRRTFFGNIKNYEIRACAACAFGMLGKKEAVPILKKYEDSGNKLFCDYLRNALKEIAYAK